MSERTFKRVGHQILSQVFHFSIIVQFVFQKIHEIHGNLQGKIHAWTKIKEKNAVLGFFFKYAFQCLVILLITEKT